MKVEVDVRKRYRQSHVSQKVSFPFFCFQRFSVVRVGQAGTEDSWAFGIDEGVLLQVAVHGI